MKPQRSSLYVPGNKAAWIEKAADYAADSLVLDLEDSVPVREKVQARSIVKEGLKFLKKEGQEFSVRINGLATGFARDDLEAVICPELESVLLPKVETVDDMKELDLLLSGLERRRNMKPGAVETPLVLETARAMRSAYDICVGCPRVTGVTLAALPGGDAGRSVGYVWSKEGTETLYIRSKAVLDARAAGIDYPLISSWWDIEDLEGLRKDATLNRSLGFRGQQVMHPSHVPVVNDVFTPTSDEISFCKGVIEAVKEGEKEGKGSVTYKGDMIDCAMSKTARQMLDFARSIGLKV